MTWEECRQKRMVKEVSVDKALISSLEKSSQKKLASSRLLELNDTTASSIITLLYDSMRELLGALGIVHGYKIYNHECYTSFLLVIIKEEKLAAQFDSVRKIRNGINYYGEELSIEDAKLISHDLLSLRASISHLLK